MGYRTSSSSVNLYFHHHKASIPIRLIAEADAAVAAIRRKPRQEHQDIHHSQSVDANTSSHVSAYVPPDHNMYTFMLHSCSNITSLKQIHTHMLMSGLDQNIFIGTKLVTLYAKYGSIVDAGLVFDNLPNKNIFSYNTMIAGYVKNGHCEESLRVYARMQGKGIEPDNFTFPFLLKACAGLSALREGKLIHYHIRRNGLESDVFVGAALIDMYAKCRKIVDARQVFNKISARDMVLWTAMISGYAQNGHDYEALTTFQQMQRAGLAIDSITIISVLLACTHLGTLQRGKCVHGYIIRIGFESDVNVANALIDMYAKCGSIYFAHKLFDIMPERDVISWSAMIAGYGLHGQCETALAFFRQMQRAGIKPNYVTFISVLSACSHAGLVNKGWEYFDSMHRVYCIGPSLRHYACMVDLLGRCGRLDEAKDFIEKMPLEPDAGVWGALLGGCRIHCNIELAEHAAEHLFSLEPQNAGYYVLLSNIYATCCRWDDVAKVRMLMRERKLKKMPGCSSIEVYSKVHSFVAEEKSHPQSGEIYAMLDILAKRLKEAGYVPDTKFVLEGLE